MLTPRPAHPRSSAAVFTRIAALFGDNPVLEKDAMTTLRSPVTAAVVATAGLAAWGLAAFVHLVEEPGNRDLLSWRGLDPSGRSMFIAVAGVLLFLTTFFLPAAASSAVAAERERGTLPLLLVSALSPARIVAGKLAALFAVVAPLFCITLPLFGLASIYGDVAAFDVVIALGLAAFHVVCVGAAGIGASSAVARARLAAPLAMLFAGVPTVLFGMPLIAALVIYSQGDDVRLVAPVLVTGGAASAAFAAACLLLARDQLSPSSAPRWPLRRRLVALVLVGLPVVAMASLRLLDDVISSDRDEVGALVTVGALLAVLVTAVIEVGIADARPVDRGSPRGRALVVAALAAVGLALAFVVPQHSQDEAVWMRGPAFAVHELPSAVVAAFYVMFAATGTALVARVVRRPVLRVVIVAVALLALFVVPFALHEVHGLFGFDRYPLGFTNPLIVLDDVIWQRADHVSWVGSLVFFGASSLIMGALAKRRPPV